MVTALKLHGDEFNMFGIWWHLVIRCGERQHCSSLITTVPVALHVDSFESSPA